MQRHFPAAWSSGDIGLSRNTLPPSLFHITTCGKKVSATTFGQRQQMLTCPATVSGHHCDRAPGKGSSFPLRRWLALTSPRPQRPVIEFLDRLSASPAEIIRARRLCGTQATRQGPINQLSITHVAASIHLQAVSIFFSPSFFCPLITQRVVRLHNRCSLIGDSKPNPNFCSPR